MARESQKWFYTAEDIAKTCGIEVNTIHQAKERGDLDLDDVGSVVIWIAKFGKPEIRKEIARAVLPTALGLTPRRTDLAKQIVANQPDLLALVFDCDYRVRKGRAKRISQHRTNKGIAAS